MALAHSASQSHAVSTSAQLGAPCAARIAGLGQGVTDNVPTEITLWLKLETELPQPATPPPLPLLTAQAQSLSLDVNFPPYTFVATGQSSGNMMQTWSPTTPGMSLPPFVHLALWQADLSKDAQMDSTMMILHTRGVQELWQAGPAGQWAMQTVKLNLSKWLAGYTLSDFRPTTLSGMYDKPPQPDASSLLLRPMDLAAFKGRLS